MFSEKITIDESDLDFIRDIELFDVQAEKRARNLKLLNTYKCLVNILIGVKHAPNFENVKVVLEKELEGLKKFILERMDNEIEIGNESKSDLEMSINRCLLNKYEDIITFLNEVNDEKHRVALKIELSRTIDHILGRMEGV